MFLLFITHATGYTELRTFPTACDRAFAMIRLAAQPVILRMADY